MLFRSEEEDLDDPFTIKVMELRQYRVEHGDCKVPAKYPRNPKLGKWVSNQKQAYKFFRTGIKKGTNTINQKQIDKLNEIGFFWVRQTKRNCFCVV